MKTLIQCGTHTARIETTYLHSLSSKLKFQINYNLLENSFEIQNRTKNTHIQILFYPHAHIYTQSTVNTVYSSSFSL